MKLRNRRGLVRKIRLRRKGQEQPNFSLAPEGYSKNLKNVISNIRDLSTQLISQCDCPACGSQFLEAFAGHGLLVQSEEAAPISIPRKMLSVPPVAPASRDFVLSLPPAPVATCPVLPPMKPTKKDTLVLDLDETLVHCSLEPLEDATFRIDAAVATTIFVRTRPHLSEFLDQVSRHFELIVFTAGLRQFANQVLNALDPERRLFEHRLFRDMCYIKDGKYVKNLNILGRDLDKTVILDDCPEAFGFQPDNGILIRPWCRDPDDEELLKAASTLDALRGSGKAVPRFLREDLYRGLA